MREELFDAIKVAIEERVTEIQHIDVWNHNVEFLEYDTQWAMPAVFVEFGDRIDWTAFKDCMNLRGAVLIRLHIVTESTKGGNQKNWRICNKIRKALHGLCGDNFSRLTLSESYTNHNYDQIIENIDAYTVCVEVGC